MKGKYADRITDEITERFKREPCIDKVVLFGSRARGDNSERSDYDIAVYGSVPYKVRCDLHHFCSEQIRTLHKIDLVFVGENTNPKFLENIEKDGIVLYEQIAR